jgi:hypothetical protein
MISVIKLGNLISWLTNGLKWRFVVFMAPVQQLISKLIPDRIALTKRFERRFGYPLNLKNPQTFGEKLFWLMLYHRTPQITRIADKFEVRNYVTERVGPSILNELYGAWNSVDEIDFDVLPDAFTLKVTSGSGRNIFVTNKSELDTIKIKRQLTSWMNDNYYWHYREWCYKNIKPKIICERLLTNDISRAPLDYKFFCFGGEPSFVVVNVDRFRRHAIDFFDLNWQRLPFTYDNYASSEISIPRPGNLDEMLDCARKLSAGFPFLRVDLYSIEGRTIFGEITCYPAAGEEIFIPSSYNYDYGTKLQLPKECKISYASILVNAIQSFLA